MFTVAIVSDFPESEDKISGGVESAVWRLVQGLKEYGDIKIVVIAPCRSNESKDVLAGVDVIRYKSLPIPGFLNYWTHQRHRIGKILKKISPDIVHYQALAGWGLFSSYTSVLTIHGIAELDLQYKGGAFNALRYHVVRLVESYARKSINNIVLINSYVKKFLPDRDEYRFIPNAIDDKYYEVIHKPQGHQLLYVGRVSELKNIKGMLEVFNLLLKRVPDAFLNIVGSAEKSDYLNECIDYVNAENISDKVCFLGGKSTDDICKLMQQSSCLVLLSKQENAPMIISEGMAAGLAVVASNICGIPNMIEDNVTGYLVDPGSPDLIVDKVEKLLLNKELQNKIGRAAKHSSECYRKGAVAKATYEYYLELCKNR